MKSVVDQQHVVIDVCNAAHLASQSLLVDPESLEISMIDDYYSP